MLTAEQLLHYREKGYVVVPNLLTSAEIDAFIDQWSKPKPAGFQGFGLQGHVSDPQFKRVANHPNVVSAVRQIMDSGHPRIVQTMYMDKPAKGGKGIALHQDTHYLPSDPNTLMACWIALSDTDADNGGLCVVPGSHQTGLRKFHQNKGDENHDSFEFDYEMSDRNGRTWKEKMFRFEIEDLDAKSVVRLTVPKGAGVFFTGMTIHGSYANNSPDRPRRAFATHYIKDGTWLFRKDVQETTPVEG